MNNHKYFNNLQEHLTISDVFIVLLSSIKFNINKNILSHSVLISSFYQQLPIETLITL